MRRALLIAMLIAAACRTPEQQAKAARETADSWAAAGAMLSQEWARGTVTDAYARSTVRVARQEIAPLGVPAQLHAWDTLAAAIEKGDRNAALRAAEDFRKR